MLASRLRVWRITPKEWIDFIRAQLALGEAVLALKFRSRGQLLAYQEQSGDGQLPPQQLHRARELEQALDRAMRFGLIRPKCLARSLALHRMLLRSGIRGSRIRIGVRPEPDGLNAHAWVTLASRILGDDPRFVSRFTEIADAQMAELS